MDGSPLRRFRENSSEVDDLHRTRRGGEASSNRPPGLLYWDSVATIVPAELLEHPGGLKLYTSELIQAGLLKTVVPDDTIWQSGATNYRESFLNLIDETPGLVTGTPLDRPTTRIHTDKTGTGLAQAWPEATRESRTQLDGAPSLVRAFPTWNPRSMFAHIKPVSRATNAAG